jgi:hypothetical protein
MGFGEVWETLRRTYSGTINCQLHYEEGQTLTALSLSDIISQCRSAILPVVLYGCETWFLILREECRLKVFENRVLRRIFGPKREELTVDWRKLHNEELNNLYSSSSIIRVIKSRRMRWAGHVARMGEKRNVYRILVEKPEGKRQY